MKAVLLCLVARPFYCYHFLMQKKTLLSIIVISVLVLIVGCYAWYQHKNRENHIWTRYENKALGFSLEYPADRMKLMEGSPDEPHFVSFLDLQNGYESIKIGTQSTNVSDTDAYRVQWRAQHGNDFPFDRTTTMAGRVTLVQEYRDSYNTEVFIFVAQEQLYIMTISLPSKDIEHIRESFKIIE